MPAVSAKARARITAIFFMAVPLFQLFEDCQNRARTSVTAITFWSFSRAGAKQHQRIGAKGQKPQREWESPVPGLLPTNN
jgi:hypothetical protein